MKPPLQVDDRDDSWRVVDADGKTVFDDGAAAGEYGQKCTEADRDHIIKCVNLFPDFLSVCEKLNRHYRDPEDNAPLYDIVELAESILDKLEPGQ